MAHAWWGGERGEGGEMGTSTCYHITSLGGGWVAWERGGAGEGG
jgi:hypothetical protein